MDYRRFNIWEGRKIERPRTPPYGIELDRSSGDPFNKKAQDEYWKKLREAQARAKAAWLDRHGFGPYRGKFDAYATRERGTDRLCVCTQPYVNLRPMAELVDAVEARGFVVIHAGWDGWHYPECAPLIVIAPKAKGVR